MQTQNSVMHLLIAKNVNRTASATATDPSASTYIATGEIAVTDVSGTVLDTTTVQAVDRIVIVQSQGATLPSIKSPIIELSGIKAYQSKAYAAATLQIDYIGYNAATNAGDIDVINDNGYEIVVKDINSASYGSLGVEKFGFYVSDASATKQEIADGLAVSLYENIAHLTYVPMIVERVNSTTAGTDTTGATGTITATNGSKILSATVASGANGLVADAYIKFSAAATDTGAIYKIVSLPTATTFELDQPYQGATATFTAGNASSATLAQLNAGSTGIRLTAKAAVFVSPQNNEVYQNKWITSVRNAGTTPVVKQVTPTDGVGTYPQVSSLEYFLQGNEGFISRNDFPYVTPRQNALAAGTYHFLTLEWNSTMSGGIFSQETNPKQLMMAFDFTAGSPPTQAVGAVTAVQDVLNVWIPSSIGTGALA